MRSVNDVQHAFEYGMAGSRGDVKELIVEEFVDFDYEITLLTLTQDNGHTLFCPPIGHVQQDGDYRESFQPRAMRAEHLAEAERMAKAVTEALTGAGIWGVEFFVSEKNGVYFSELSPRPHDTGMVTLAGTQNFNEFELHCRAALSLPVPCVKTLRIGASAVILADENAEGQPDYIGLEQTCEVDTDVRIFGKPTMRPKRRMGVVLVSGELDANLDEIRMKAKKLADCVRVIRKND